MFKIIHRINTLEGLKKINTNYGVEIDLRSYNDKIILNHEPFIGGDSFEKYLKYYNHKFLILNIKESGIEDMCIELLKKYDINDYFLLDCEFPYIYKSTRKGNKKIAIRYSEDELIGQALLYKDKVDYLFIDTNTQLPIDKHIINDIKGFIICLVSPDRWGRPEDIIKYKKTLNKLKFKVDMIMVGKEFVDLWD